MIRTISIRLFFALATTCIAAMLHSCFQSAHGERETATATQMAISPDKAYAMRVIDEINDYRQSIGLTRLTYCDTIYDAALAHCQYMKNQGTISHDNIQSRIHKIRDTFGSSVWISASAENVAYNMSTDPRVVVHNQWLRSQGHKANIENAKFTHSAVAITRAADVIYYTQIFIAIQ